MKEEEIKIIAEEENFKETDDGNVVRVVTIKKKKIEVDTVPVKPEDFMPSGVAKELEITSEEIKALGDVLIDTGINQSREVKKETEFEEQVKEVLNDEQKIDYLMNKMYDANEAER